MANEILLSPGVSLQENDQSQITTGPIVAGLALVGPTVKGRPNIPTLVTSYSDYKSKFGDSFTSGSSTYEYLTSLAAYNYFQQGGQSILVNRVTSGSYTSATSSITNSLPQTSDVKATDTGSLAALSTSANKDIKVVYGTKVYRFIDLAGSLPDDDLDGDVYFYQTDPAAGNTDLTVNFVNKVNAILGTNGTTAKLLTLTYDNGTNQFYGTAIPDGAAGNGIYITTGDITPYYDVNYALVGYVVDPIGQLFETKNGINGTPGYAFTLETLAEGVIQNSFSTQLTNGALTSGSKDNIRWEVVGVDTGSGVFSLVIRGGNDTTTEKSILETWNNLSLDPNSENYIERVIGNYKVTPTYDSSTGKYYLKEEGTYAVNSRYVRVKEVITPTLDYFDNAGVAKYTYVTTTPQSQYNLYMPVVGSGSFGGATGDDLAYTTLLYDKIATDTQRNTQGVFGGTGTAGNANSYAIAADILANKEEFNFQLLATPGLLSVAHPTPTNAFTALAEERGDCFYILDLVAYGATVNTVKNQATALNTSYAASYWPWVQMASQANGKLVWVPASTVMPGVYAFNDRVAAEWFAPAGMNRGGIGGAIRAERKLATADRDTLYTSKVNSIATFPGVGLVAYGQKTLQTKASALDRVNVRRLLIALKRYIGDVANTLLFEQNTVSTRNNFLSQVNPYLESVQQRQGLYAYKVVMDDTNNTADVIDRNQLVGAIYIQPTKTIEYIYLTFNITPTGVSFE